MTEVTLVWLFFIIMFCLIILGLILDALDTPSEKLTEEEKEKKLSELRYDSLDKERRYLKFREKDEFQERLIKEMEIKGLKNNENSPLEKKRKRQR